MGFLLYFLSLIGNEFLNINLGEDILRWVF